MLYVECVHGTIPVVDVSHNSDTWWIYTPMQVTWKEWKSLQWRGNA